LISPLLEVALLRFVIIRIGFDFDSTFTPVFRRVDIRDTTVQCWGTVPFVPFNVIGSNAPATLIKVLRFSKNAFVMGLLL
jgi:hypothetical protein